MQNCCYQDVNAYMNYTLRPAMQSYLTPSITWLGWVESMDLCGRMEVWSKKVNRIGIKLGCLTNSIYLFVLVPENGGLTPNSRSCSWVIWCLTIGFGGAPFSKPVAWQVLFRQQVMFGDSDVHTNVHHRYRQVGPLRSLPRPYQLVLDVSWCTAVHHVVYHLGHLRPYVSI